MGKPKILFLVPYPQDQAPSQRFRFEQYLPLLQQQGVGFRVVSFWSLRAWQVLYRKGYYLQKMMGLLQGLAARLLLVPQLPRYTYIFIHREVTPIGPPWFEWLAANVFRKKIIYDFDDAIWLETAGNVLAKSFKRPQKAVAICSWSYKISCGNSYLQQFALQYNAAAIVVPTTIDTERHHNKLKEHTHHKKAVIGWTGTHSTLPYLLQLEPVLLQLEQRYEFELLVIADKKPCLQLKSWRFLPWQKQTEVEDLLQIDIGIMPLPDTEWSKGKCAFKALQYMALGIPAVVSAVGENVKAVPDRDAGYLCHTEEDWLEHLGHLLLNPTLRGELGAQGRKQVQQHYSVEANKDVFLRLFS